MAEVKEITKDIKDTFGSSFINQNQARKYLGMSKDKAGSFLASLPVYRTGREKKYHASDIAKHMDKLRTYENYGG